MQYMQVIDFHKYTATNRHKWTLIILAAIFNFKFKTGPVNGRFSISFPSFDMNLNEIYFIAIVHCVFFLYIFFDFVYFHDSCFLPVQMLKLQMYFHDSCFLPVQMLELWWRRKPKALSLSCFCTVNDLGPNIHWTSNYGTGARFTKLFMTGLIHKT